MVAILATIVITRQDRSRADKRFADEQARHETEVSEERRLAEARLKTQQDQSEAHPLALRALALGRVRVRRGAKELR